MPALGFDSSAFALFVKVFLQHYTANAINTAIGMTTDRLFT